MLRFMEGNTFDCNQVLKMYSPKMLVVKESKFAYVEHFLTIFQILVLQNWLELVWNEFTLKWIKEFTLKCANDGCIRSIIIRIYHQLPNKANSSHKPTFFLRITTLFLSSLLFCESRFSKENIIFQIRK